jgi:26S proteasome regulatory subunit N5
LASTGKVLVAIVEACHARRQFQALNEHLVLLSKRRGLLKEVR